MDSVAQAIEKSSNAAQSLNHNKSMYQKLSCPHLEDNDTSCDFDTNLKTMIIHLNDEHKWSREDIADWLDTLENQPVFYPDIRTDDEKIEETQLVFAYGINNSLAGAWVKSPQYTHKAKVQLNLTSTTKSVILYNSNGSINQSFAGPGSLATWEITFDSYGGNCYVCVYDISGNCETYTPKPNPI